MEIFVVLVSEMASIRVVDLRSDTVSMPTDEMLKAMTEAKLGDDVYGEDPTVSALERKSAALLGKEAAIFVPSGTMGNLIAVLVHCNKRGSEVIVGEESHVFLYEQGGSAQFGGVQLNPIPNNPDGTFCLDKFKRKFRFYDQHEPITSLAIVENTHNMCGGKVIPLEWLDEFTKICRERKIPFHMDGARLFNAAACLSVPAARICRDFDSVNICLSKSLSAPIGSVLVGSSAFIEQARRMRKALGGGMRQVGVLGAAGIVALDTVVPKLYDDHQRLRRIADAIDKLNSPYVTVDVKNLHTNICMIRCRGLDNFTPEEFCQRLLQVREDEIANGVTDQNGNGIVIKASARDWQFMRIVIYHQITDELTDLAIKKFKYCIENIEKDNPISA